MSEEEKAKRVKSQLRIPCIACILGVLMSVSGLVIESGFPLLTLGIVVLVLGILAILPLLFSRTKIQPLLDESTERVLLRWILRIGFAAIVVSVLGTVLTEFLEYRFFDGHGGRLLRYAYITFVVGLMAFFSSLFLGARFTITWKKATRRLFWVSAALCFMGLLSGCAGLFVSSVPGKYIYLGYVLFSLGLLGFLPGIGAKWWVYVCLLVCWTTGVFLQLEHYRIVKYGDELEWSLSCGIELAVWNTVCMAGAWEMLLVLTCLVSTRKSRLRHISIASYPLAIALGFYLLPHMNVQLIKRYPTYAEEIHVTVDDLADKNPTFIDDEALWDTKEVRTSLKVSVNKSAAVVGLDLGEMVDHEKETTERLFPDYASAIGYAEDNYLTTIPSVQTIDHKAKTFADQFYAAVERYVQETSEALGGGKRAFLLKLLDALIKTYDGSAEHACAIAYIATGLHLAEEDIPPLPQAAQVTMKDMKRKFLAHPIKSKPVGFYTKSEELKRIFRQDRFYQSYIPIESAIVIARVFLQDPALRKQYQTILLLYGRLTNPQSRFSVDDVAEYRDWFGQPKKLASQMLKSDKWKALTKRGAGRERPIPCIQLLPHSTSKENELFAKIYNYSGVLPEHNIMNVLIKAIRSGELDLIPADESGWYDYQIHALETLLIPEKGEEGEKLLLTAEYKKRLIEAFKTILTKKRELHVKQVELIPVMGIAMEAETIVISPDLSLEPTATYYLRTARGFRFVLDALEVLLGKNAPGAARLGSDTPLGPATDEMMRLYYGLYLKVCEDIGMLPSFLDGELSEAQIQQAQEEAARWLEEWKTDDFCKEDVRVIVSALSDADRERIKYWMVIGVKLLKVKAEYVRRPRVRVTYTRSSGEVIEEEIPAGKDSGTVCGWWTYRFAPEERFIPVEIFAEAEGPADPPTREQFRKLCDKLGSKKKIIRAIEKGCNRLK